MTIGAGDTNSAALLCAQYSGFADDHYWSSSERDNGVSVWSLDFSTNESPHDFNKYVTWYVRCASAF